MKNKIISFNGINISNTNPLVLIAGPCVIENENATLEIAEILKKISQELNISLIFKASYDKANRSSISSFRGPGLKNGLLILSKVKEKYGLPIITDVHCPHEVMETAKVADVLQIPAFLCRQTDLLAESAKTGLPVNVKKGQFLAPEDTSNIINKIEQVGNKNIILTERGTSFGYHNLVVDMRSLSIMKQTGYPVVFDATHSVQLPGGNGLSTGGQREFIMPLSRAAVSIGIAGVFLEVHPDPKKALSDGPNSLSLDDLPHFLEIIFNIDKFIKHDIGHIINKRRYL